MAYKVAQIQSPRPDRKKYDGRVMLLPWLLE